LVFDKTRFVGAGSDHQLIDTAIGVERRFQYCFRIRKRIRPPNDACDIPADIADILHDGFQFLGRSGREQKFRAKRAKRNGAGMTERPDAPVMIATLSRTSNNDNGFRIFSLII